MKAATAARRKRRLGGGPEQSEGIAVSRKELERIAFYATRSRVIQSAAAIAASLAIKVHLEGYQSC